MPTEVGLKMHSLVSDLQAQICAALETEDSVRFKSDKWERPGGGGGHSRVIVGDTFEKGGVNVSQVSGNIKTEEAGVFQLMLAQQGFGAVPVEGANFFATGISLVIHPRNPYVPTTHANYRYFELETNEGQHVWWFGGGADLTPYYLFEEDARHFHQIHRRACDAIDLTYYPRFKKWCDEYFYLPHRGETRGIGGIFYDYLKDREPSDLMRFASLCGQAFIDAYVPIVSKRRCVSWGAAEREWQEIRRGRYAEFNLVYDRGTLFGLKTNGRTESILMSLPPHVQWRYCYEPAKNTPEEALISVLKTPRNWE